MITRSHMSLGKKLFWSLGAALALTLVVSVASMEGFGQLGSVVHKLGKEDARKLYLAGEVSTISSSIVADETGIALHGLLQDKQGVAAHAQGFRDGAARMKSLLEEYASIVPDEQGRRLISELQAAANRLVQTHDEFFGLIGSEKADAALAIFNSKSVALLNQFKEQGEHLAQHENAAVTAVGESAEASVAHWRWLAVAVASLAFLVGIGVVFIVRQINRGLRVAVLELSETAGQVANAAAQVACSSQSLAQGASEQAASLEETSASTEEINSMSHRNRDNSRTAAEVVAHSQTRFSEANRSLDLMVVAMSEINSSSDKISKIIKVIDEIAFQTNILALNAAVEAARAGEAGMGFAVVADEVRNLAQRCAQAARDTSSLIEESINKSNDGKTKVDEVAASIRAVTEEAGKIKTLVDEVSLGSEEQARGLEQIGKAITQMEQVTQSNAANAEESASAAAELTSESGRLREIIAALSALVDGARTAGRPGFVASAPAKKSATGKRVDRPAPHAMPVSVALDDPKSSFPMDGDFREI